VKPRSRTRLMVFSWNLTIANSMPRGNLLPIRYDLLA
jgi:hypothetical protein